MKHFLIILILLIYGFSLSSQIRENEIQDAQIYLLGKYDKYDILILGEHHWLKSEVEFMTKMLPLLHGSGVNVFAFEYLAFTAQPLIDSLLAKEKFDKQLVNLIINEKPHWYVKEYMNILHVLWKINHTSTKKIRVLGCDASSALLYTMDNDSMMAKCIIADYLKYGEKIFIYCGRNHGFTSFRQYKFDKKTEIIRLGNIVYNHFPEKVTNIAFFPMVYLENYDTRKQYFLFDILFSKKQKNVGFDLKGSSIENIITDDVVLRNNSNFKLGTFYDGAIYLDNKLRMCSPHNRLNNEIKNELKKYKKLIRKIKYVNQFGVDK
jgi:hypothetical protein